MFRELVRYKQALTEEECVRLLKEQPRGFLSVLGDDDYPYVMPINQYYNEEDGKIYFHGGMAGHKIDAMKKHDKVSFCVIDEGAHENGQWWLTFRSVIVFGRVEFVEDREKTYDISSRLSRKFTGDEAYIANELDKSGPRTLMFALVPEHISGKKVNER